LLSGHAAPLATRPPLARSSSGGLEIAGSIPSKLLEIHRRIAMKIDSLDTLFYEEAKDIYDAEKQLTKAIPKMAKAAHSDELRAALQEHLTVTEGQVKRLEQVFDLMGQSPKSKPCEGMKGLIEEGKEVMDEDAEDPFFDAAIIGAAQKVEHYEIAAYGTLRTMAERLGNQEAADLLQESLDEEKEADEKLTEVAMELLEQEPERSSRMQSRMQPTRINSRMGASSRSAEGRMSTAEGRSRSRKTRRAS
jgi:ferritin-like metal-binding protein YciE